MLDSKFLLSFFICICSLKQEYEVKFKSLEERLTLVTGDKEKQAKSFEEKMQNFIKEHQVEIQRLKELHKYMQKFYYTFLIANCQFYFDNILILHLTLNILFC